MLRFLIKLTKSKLFHLLPLLLAISFNCYASSAHISQYYQIHKFIQEMVTHYNFDKKNLDRIFNDVQFRPDVIDSMNKPAESLSWDRYRALFITPKRIQLGAQFWHAHAKALALAQKRYGVSPSIIVAIIGVETFYGKNSGNYRVIDTLSTLAFAYPPRQKYFRNELKEYLLLTRELGLDPLELRGSYAGAIGLPQFMPSSYRTFAVSMNNSPHIDLINNPNDAILSVANYFKNNGWQPGQPVDTRAHIKKPSAVNLVHKFGKPQMTLAEFARSGVHPTGRYNQQKKAALIQLQGKKSSEYWLTFANFYSIIRYNGSINYAMVTYQLSQNIAQQMKTKAKPTLAPPPSVAKPKVVHGQLSTIKKPQLHLTHQPLSSDPGMQI
ncbi:MAG: lytic murein transglycosylase B [Gammaproteobacteria bacterium]